MSNVLTIIRRMVLAAVVIPPALAGAQPVTVGFDLSPSSPHPAFSRSQPKR